MRRRLLAATVVAIAILGIGYSLAVRRTANDGQSAWLHAPLRAVATMLGQNPKNGSTDLAPRRMAAASQPPATAAPARAASSPPVDALPFAPQRPAPPLPASGSWTAPDAPPGASPTTASAPGIARPGTVAPAGIGKSAALIPPLGAPSQGPEGSSGLAVMSATTRGPQAQPLP